jgi:hypothetical protein
MEKMFKQSGLEFGEPEKRGMKQRLVDRLTGKKEKDHPIYRKRMEDIHTANMQRMLVETEEMRARPEGWNPQGQTSRSEAPPDYSHHKADESNNDNIAC